MSVDLFDANFYRAANSDLAAAGLTTDAQLRSHFQNFGIDEGRLFSSVANINFYRASNSDLAAAGLNTNRQALNHLQNFGVAEGRNFSQFVDINFYLNTNSDVNQAYRGNKEQALGHLRSFGINEGRIFSPFIGFVDQETDTYTPNDTFRGLNYYLQLNPDVNQAVGGSRVRALEHLEIYGVNETRSFSPFVDVGYYLAANPDVNQAFRGNRGRAFEHLVSFGVNEPRQWSPAFNVVYYRDTNPDLRDAGFRSGRQLFEHWGRYGAFLDERFGTPDPGNSLNTALNMDSLDPSATFFNGSVNNSDRNDYYRFTLTESRNIIIALVNGSDDLDLNLLDASGGVIQSSTAVSDDSDAVSYLNLNPGTYSIRVYQGSDNASSSYGLSIGVVFSQDPGNTVSTAYPLYSLVNDFIQPGRIVIQDTVGDSDTADYYQFNLTSATTFDATLDPFSADADLFLLDSNGNQLSSSIADGTNIDRINSITLDPGTYFVRINGLSTNTSYQLTLNAA